MTALHGRPALLGLAALFVVLAPSAGGSRALAEEGERIALLPLTLSGPLRVKRETLEGAVGQGLAVAGRPVLPPDAVLKLLRPPGRTQCETEACWADFARRLTAAHLVKGYVRAEDSRFLVRFELLQAGSGRTLAVEQADCAEQDCSVAEVARLAARELLRKTLGKKESLAGARGDLDRGTTPTGAVVPPVVATAPTAPPPPPPGGPVVNGADATSAPVQTFRPGPTPRALASGPSPRRVASVAMMAGGLAAIGVGAFLISRDGSGSCVSPEECAQRYSMAEGVTLAGVGAALAGSGLYLFVRENGTSGTDVALGVSPRGLLMRGRF